MEVNLRDEPFSALCVSAVLQQAIAMCNYIKAFLQCEFTWNVPLSALSSLIYVNAKCKNIDFSKYFWHLNNKAKQANLFGSQYGFQKQIRHNFKPLFFCVCVFVFFLPSQCMFHILSSENKLLSVKYCAQDLHICNFLYCIRHYGCVSENWAVSNALWWNIQTQWFLQENWRYYS